MASYVPDYLLVEDSWRASSTESKKWPVPTKKEKYDVDQLTTIAIPKVQKVQKVEKHIRKLMQENSMPWKT